MARVFFSIRNDEPDPAPRLRQIKGKKKEVSENLNSNLKRKDTVVLNSSAPAENHKNPFFINPPEKLGIKAPEETPRKEEENASKNQSLSKKIPEASLKNGAILVARAKEEQFSQNDIMQAQQIYIQMAAERRLWQQKMWALVSDIQTEILKLWEEVVLRRQKVMNDLSEKWAKALGISD